MKKIITLVIAMYLVSSMSACGMRNKVDDVVTDIAESVTDMIENASGNKEPSKDNNSKVKSAEELLSKIWDGVDEDSRFAIGGGDSANITMDTPGRFDITNEEELDVTLAFPMSQMDKIDDAASMVHMMNANTFTGAAYHLKDGASADSFAADFKETIKNRRWMCGFPDCYTVIEADGYVITAFGAREQVENFKKSTEKTVSGARVIMTEDIS